jgi:hypothetical protein
LIFLEWAKINEMRMHIFLHGFYNSKACGDFENKLMLNGMMMLVVVVDLVMVMMMIIMMIIIIIIMRID